MCAICDVNEYRKCVKKFKITLVDTLFETLHGLCNLLLVKPENLKQVCNGDQLVRQKMLVPSGMHHITPTTILTTFHLLFPGWTREVNFTQFRSAEKRLQKSKNF